MHLFRSPRKAGFECGTTGARMVVLVRKNGSLLIERVFLEEVLFESRFKGIARSPIDVSRQLLIHKSLPNCKTIFCAPGPTESAFVILPKMAKADTLKAVHLQSVKVASWEAESPIINFTSYDFLRERAGHLVGLADWAGLRPWIKLFENSDALIDDITIPACAFEALAQHQKWADEFPVVLVVDIGASDTWFYAMDRRSVRFMRKVPVGGDALTRALTTVISTESGPLELSNFEAESAKINGCLPSSGKGVASDEDRAAAESGVPVRVGRLQQMNALLRPVLERFGSEISRSIQFYKDNAGKQADAVFLAGGSVKLELLMSHLEQAVQLPIRVIDPFAGLSFESETVKEYARKNSARLAVATGLALADKPSVTLMPRTMHILKRVAAFMPRAVTAVLVLVFLPLLVAGSIFSNKVRNAKGELENMKSALAAAASQQSRYEGLLDQVVDITASLQNLRERLEWQPLWAGVMNELAAAVPDEVVLTMAAYGIDEDNPDAFLLGGSVVSSETRFDDVISQLLTSLNSSIFFRKVTIVSAQAAQQGDDFGTFQVRCELVY